MDEGRVLKVPTLYLIRMVLQVQRDSSADWQCVKNEGGTQAKRQAAGRGKEVTASEQLSPSSTRQFLVRL
uniref:Uncharacterized protein n=1 Tax=Timema tahoe TaxID=61484 RepID=A0A7R9FF76_9NEOP|nr:unnamed protein product [Timema tahoe]